MEVRVLNFLIKRFTLDELNHIAFEDDTQFDSQIYEKWKDNVKPVERTYLQSYDFLIDSYKESVTKKIMSHEGYDQL